MIFTPFAFMAETAAGPVDPDAQAFLTATGITDPTITSAIDTLVTNLKGYGLWSKFNAIYPMVGGTSTTTKYNLINPLDTNAAFRLSFTAGWTFASTGVTGNGSSTYADTFLAPNSHLSLNNTHLSYYSRTANNGAADVEMGVSDGSNSLFIAPRYSGGTGNYRAVNASQIGPGASPTSEGFFQVSRILSTESKQYKNGSIINTDSVTSGGLSTNNIWIGAYNSGTPYPTDRECAFASIGEGMTDVQAGNFYTAVQAFQTTLSRQV